MPRDSSGNYTLPSGNPVISGTTITSNWANDTMNDMANEMTNSLSRDGEGGMNAPLQFVDGALLTPGIAWVLEPSLGFYRAGTQDMRGSVNNRDAIRITLTNRLEIQRDHGSGETFYLAVDTFMLDEVEAEFEPFWDSKYDGFLSDGSHLQYVDDLDDIAVNSVYLMRASVVANPPPGMGTDWGFVETLIFQGSPADATQIVVGQSGASIYKQWQRTQAAGVWEAWILIVDGGAFTLRLAGLADTGFAVDYTDDLDDIVANSMYNIIGTAANAPPELGTERAFLWTQLAEVSTRRSQLCYGVTGTASYRIWKREYVDTWDAWKLVVDGQGLEFDVNSVATFSQPIVNPGIFYSHSDGTGNLSRSTGDWTVNSPSTGVYNYTFNVVQPDIEYSVIASIGSSSIGFLGITGISVNGFTVSTFSAAQAAANRGHDVLFTRAR